MRTEVVVSGVFLWGMSAVSGLASPVSAVAEGLWTAGATWADSNPAGPGNDYFIPDTLTVLSPSGGGAFNFAGDSLTVESGGVLRLQNNHSTTIQTSTYTIPSLSLQDGATVLARATSGVGATNYRLQNSVSVSGNATLQLGSGDFFSYLTLLGGLTGDGTVNFQRIAGGGTQDFRFNVHGVNNTFSGDWNLSGTRTTIFARDAGAMGTGAITASNNMLVDNTVAGGLDTLTLINLVGTGTLQLTNPFSNSSAGWTLEAGSELIVGDGDSIVGSLNIDGNAVPNGTYTAGQLTALGFGGTFSGSGTVSVVPEPSVLSLIAVALGAVGVLRRRR